MRKVAASFLFAGILCVLATAQTPDSPAPTATPTPAPRAPTIKNDVTVPNSARRPPALSGESTTILPSTSAKPKPSSTTSSDDEVITIETNLVTTPVTVLDRSGRFIPGLKKKDFKIFDNGVAQKVTYFQSVETPFTVILLIDISPSTKYHIDQIHFAAVTFVNQLRPSDKVMVVAFDQRIRVLTQEPTADRQQIYAAIYKSQFGSGTSLYDAVDFVANVDVTSVPGRKAVVLFTDGVDTTSRKANYQSAIASVEEVDALFYTIRYDTQRRGDSYTGMPGPPTPPTRPRSVDELIAAALRGQLPSGTIRMGRGDSSSEYERGRVFLETIAQNSGGRMFEADTIENLETSFSGVAEELRRQYSVGYYPENTGEPGERRKIKVQVARPNVIVRSKTGYVIGQGK